MQKQCNRCRLTKDSCEFGKRASAKDGLDGRCLKCIRECSKQSDAKNRAKNKCGALVQSKVCGTCRIEKNSSAFGTSPCSKDGLRHECKGCRNIKARQRYAIDSNFRARESVRFAKLYKENRDAMLAKTNQWSKDNPSKKGAQSYRRRARCRGQVGFDLPVDYKRVLEELQEGRCIYCSEP